VGRRQQQREDTRQRLLEVARRQFGEHGFEATQLREIAREAGVALGTLYVHFADKRDLLHTALFDDLEQALQDALQSGPAPLEPWLVHLAGVFFDHYAARPALSRVLLRESLVCEPPWSTRFTGQLARVHAAVVQRFEVARSQGEVSGDAALFAVAFISFYTFALLAWVQDAHPAPRELVARLVSAHLAGARP
jgi:AcrR family transcriptional regulator